MTNTLYQRGVIRVDEGSSSSAPVNQSVQGAAEPVSIGSSNIDELEEAISLHRNQDRTNTKGKGVILSVIEKFFDSSEDEDGETSGYRTMNSSFRSVFSSDDVVESVVEVQNGEKQIEGEEKRDRSERNSMRRSRPNPRLSNPPKNIHGEQVAAGWPSWLSMVAGEAIKGWIPLRADTFEKLDKIGQGTYGNVYKGRDTLTGNFVALKKVKFNNLEPESVKFMAREILVLRRLDHPNVVKLEGLVTLRMSCSLYLVLEYMEHDLAGLAASPGIKFTESQVKCYMHQLISGLEHCHTRGVLHRDINGSNLLLDNGGVLKVADFGSASFFNPNHKQPMTSRVVTLWYRPPELLLGSTDYGVGVDLWSAGCILAELLAGKPIMTGRTEVEQVLKIFKLCGSPSEEYWKQSKFPNEIEIPFKPRLPYKRCIAETFKNFPPSSLPLIETLLAIDPAERQTATAALSSNFFMTKPYACEPSSLPQYPPSKARDVKLRDEEIRRLQAAGGKINGDGANKTHQRDRAVRAIPAPQANAELQANLDVYENGSGGERDLRRRSRPNPRLSNPPKNIHGEQVAAGWPSWLSMVAGEAIKGWIPLRADTFEKLYKIGQGTYGNVYKGRDTLTGNFVALKKVKFNNLEPESVKFMAREILVLRRLDHPNVVKLEGLVTLRMSCSLYLVLEYMEHDLAGLAASPGIKFTESQVKCYMHQLISGLEHCHTRGVLHRDINGSNLLLDNGGVLKVADFGSASFFNPNHKQPMTSRVVTLWYRPPELLLGSTDYGVGVDLWSAGCILAELLAGKPIMTGRTEVEQVLKIFKLCGSPSEEYWKQSKFPNEIEIPFKPRLPYKRCIAETFKNFPPSSLPLIETLLAIDPAERQTATAALSSNFFMTEPYACEPSSLPQYPPSKARDVKLRDEEIRRLQAAGGKINGDGANKTRPRDRAVRAIPAPQANAELQANLDRRHLITHANAKSKSGKFPPPHQDGTLGFPFKEHRKDKSGY